MDQPLTISPHMMPNKIFVKRMYHANYADWDCCPQVETNIKGFIPKTVIG